MPRRLITVKGVVQGVGFRPFAYALASRLGLAGFVRNRGGDVCIEVEGPESTLDIFMAELSSHAPCLARIHELSCESIPEAGEASFTIDESLVGGTDSTLILPDIATCDECLSELSDPVDRRFGYAFVNCTNCGPRLTIITAAPYDRPRTTMAAFAMCSQCRREYEDPADRRFHAQPIACPECGPRLIALDASGTRMDTDPLRFAAEALKRGRIGALKGLGGYHLVCDGRNEAAVAALRRRKNREERPFAIMVASIAAARALCKISQQEQELLASPARPILLLRARAGGVAESVAPGNPYLGLMLPYTPLHHLLLQAVADTPLVMTSGNRSGEPIVYDDCTALARLKDIADFFITHDREISVPCDDSVMRIVAERPMPLRRSRGYVPAPVALPVFCRVPILALGGQLKATFALGRGQQAIVSHHLGDLDYYEAYRAYSEAVARYQRLFAFEPEVIAHDLHPDYATTRFARECILPGARMAVQHHHAHLASCLAEHGLDEPVIGVILDGTGYGTDGAVWGGEFLIGDYRGYERAAHLRYVRMPGGEKAIREPWRMAVAHLTDAGLDCDMLLHGNTGTKDVAAVQQMIARRFNAQWTSSVGRLFDAVSAVIGVRSCVDYEGQAAAELEWLATDVAEDGRYPYRVLQPADEAPRRGPLQIDVRPLVAAIADEVRWGEQASRIARRFHTTLIEMIVGICSRLRDETGLEAVVLSGGVFMNALLLSGTVPRLAQRGFRVYRHELVPPNDGGLCLGQLAVAAALHSCENPNSGYGELPGSL